ncbi:MAG: DUF488 domain-containing protein, partial [Myxococcota bacterium]
ASLGGKAGRLDFQKLLFLYCQQSSQPSYEFVPYKYGAFSFTSYADCRKLVDRGFLEGPDAHWKLTSAGESVVGANLDMELDAFLRGYRLRGDALVADTYRRFPYFATRSEIAARVLKGDASALSRIEAVAPSKVRGAVFTIGYEGKTLEGYLNQLLKAGATVLCDVRRNPLSRKYGFSKRALAGACENVGIRYEHLPELGIASAKRKGLQTRADYRQLFAEYERDTLPNQEDALTRIGAWVEADEAVALTCYELDSVDCHRRCVSDAMAQRGVAVTHL